MITVKWRKGLSHRILDIRGKGDRYVATISFDHQAHRGCYSPSIFLFTRNGEKGITVREWHVPHISWRTGYKWRKWGGLVAHNLNQRLIYTLFARSHAWYNKP